MAKKKKEQSPRTIRRGFGSYITSLNLLRGGRLDDYHDANPDRILERDRPHNRGKKKSDEPDGIPVVDDRFLRELGIRTRP